MEERENNFMILMGLITLELRRVGRFPRWFLCCFWVTLCLIITLNSWTFFFVWQQLAGIELILELTLIAKRSPKEIIITLLITL